MSTVALFAAAGGLSWVLRAAFITLVPARRLPAYVVSVLRYAGPAAFASLLASALTGGSAAASAHLWQLIVATAVAGLVAWRLRSLMATVLSGAGAITILVLL